MTNASVSKQINESTAEEESDDNAPKELELKSRLDFQSIIADKSIIKLTRYYHEGLILKRAIDFYFNYYLKQAYFKSLLRYKKIKFKELLKLFLIKPFF